MGLSMPLLFFSLPWLSSLLILFKTLGRARVECGGTGKEGKKYSNPPVGFPCWHWVSPGPDRRLSSGPEAIVKSGGDGMGGGLWRGGREADGSSWAE